MRSLFLDLASHSGLLVCVEGDQILASSAVDRRAGDHELVPLLMNLFREIGWDFSSLTHIACAVGPGGFMSLRVAVAFTNTLIHRLKIPGAGIHLSDLCKARCAEQDFLWLHSTKKHSLFVRGFGSFSTEYPEAKCMEISEFLSSSPENFLWAGELLSEQEEQIAPRGSKPASLESLPKILPSFLQGLSYRHEMLKPWYGREG